MVKGLKIISLLLIYSGVCSLFYMHFNDQKNKYVHEEIISDVFNDEIVDDVVINDYLGYISIPRFNIERVIKSGTDSDTLDSGFVGMHRLSGCLSCNDLIILAGHNIPNVFSNLHIMDIGDVVYINSYNLSRKFIVYDMKIVNEYDFSYLVNNRKNELLLITCTMNKEERLLVFLKEDL
jgi:LPXTG-site transpeptidase (sortase) family protein